MYIARKKIRTKSGVVQPGHPVDVSGWSDRVLRAHLNVNFIYEVPDDEAPKAAQAVNITRRGPEPPTPKKKRKRKAKKTSA